MKRRIVYLILVGFLYNPFIGLSQDSIPIASNSKEENFLKFQDHFFKALAQKSIYNYRVAIRNLEKCNQLKPNDVSVLFELSKNYLMLKKFFEAEEFAIQALVIEPENYWILEHLSKLTLPHVRLKKQFRFKKKSQNKIRRKKKNWCIYIIKITS